MQNILEWYVDDHTHLYGTCPECSTSAVMTLPRVNKLWLMLPASLALPSLAPDLQAAKRVGSKNCMHK